ncbi:hypothetical protein C8T65DRAFT_639497 [Cerioporus squamosus]|nr:hypothetical protein C8T65DRAFT_639497 [Cerioporus squamosus]
MASSALRFAAASTSCPEVFVTVLVFAPLAPRSSALPRPVVLVLVLRVALALVFALSLCVHIVGTDTMFRTCMFLLASLAEAAADHRSCSRLTRAFATLSALCRLWALLRFVRPSITKC